MSTRACHPPPSSTTGCRPTSSSRRRSRRPRAAAPAADLALAPAAARARDRRPRRRLVAHARRRQEGRLDRQRPERGPSEAARGRRPAEPARADRANGHPPELGRAGHRRRAGPEPGRRPRSPFRRHADGLGRADEGRPERRRPARMPLPSTSCAHRASGSRRWASSRSKPTGTVLAQSPQAGARISRRLDGHAPGLARAGDRAGHRRPVTCRRDRRRGRRRPRRRRPSPCRPPGRKAPSWRRNRRAVSAFPPARPSGSMSPAAAPRPPRRPRRRPDRLRLRPRRSRRR